MLWPRYSASSLPDRLAYVDGDVAREWDWPSTLCRLNVSPEQAEAFDHYWVALSRERGDFSIAGDNCSTHAAEALQAAGLLPGGIPGFDTPDALYDELKRIYGEAMHCQSGYIDFNQDEAGSWTHEVLDCFRLAKSVGSSRRYVLWTGLELWQLAS